ncbi:uncharacterized protein LOC117787283 [Drosophila innubila]|uniref:uncharacterized protein LOC117787283 n=1 Tax=Drosophila innubila TaxID=198719 RepID=UPI00148E7773|nr:uncharacterized protein LOC117787283 [Drosophila innubila]
MLLKVLLLTLTVWLSFLCAGSMAKPHLLATTPLGYATAGGTWLTAATAPVATLGAATAAAYYPAYAAYTYTPVYYGSYATYPYYTYLRR